MVNQRFDQDEISKILKDRLGIGLTKSTFMRYNQQGFIMMPQKQSYTRDSKRRVLYHSLVPVEIATSYLLFRGNWLQINGSIRIARAVDQDAFIGRLLFYSTFISDVNARAKFPFTYDFADFSTAVRYYVPSDLYPSDAVSMDKDSIDSFLGVYMKLLSPFLDTGVGPSYLRYMEDAYRITFLHLYNKIFRPDKNVHPKLVRRFISPPPSTDKTTSPF